MVAEAMSDEAERKPRIFILGSCVSRDALETGLARFELVGYLARTSMASIGMPVVEEQGVITQIERLASPFQQRMLRNDLEKTTLAQLAATPYDVLLVDFIDERFDLVRTEDTVFSCSGELEKAGFDKSERSTLRPGSDEFLSLWLSGFERLLSAVDTQRLVVNRIYWAERFPDGRDASSMGWIRRNNVTLQRLYDAIDARWRLQSIEYARDMIVADPAHRWGIAPYHFVPEVYAETLAQLDGAVQRS